MKDKIFDKLFRSAKLQLDRAYSPYSKVKVASALMTTKGKIFTGCNVENVSYGATNCAERTAIFKAVSEGHKKFRAILIVTNQEMVWPPCGICRQVMAEFFGSNCIVYYTNLKKDAVKKRFSELLPGTFSPKFLSKKD